MTTTVLIPIPNKTSINSKQLKRILPIKINSLFFKKNDIQISNL